MANGLVEKLKAGGLTRFCGTSVFKIAKEFGIELPVDDDSWLTDNGYKPEAGGEVYARDQGPDDGVAAMLVYSYWSPQEIVGILIDREKSGVHQRIIYSKKPSGGWHKHIKIGEIGE